MPRITRMAAAVLAIGLLLAVPASARLIDDPQIPTSSLAGTTSESTQNLRGADAQGAPTAPEVPNPGPPTWPLDPEPIVRVPAQPLPAVSDDGGDSALKYILPAGAVALMVGAALAFAARPRRANA